MQQLCMVIRPFEADRMLQAGEVVDVSGWRLADQLIARRYIRPVAVAEISAANGPAEAQSAPTRGRRVPNAE